GRPERTCPTTGSLPAGTVFRSWPTTGSPPAGRPLSTDATGPTSPDVTVWSRLPTRGRFPAGTAVSSWPMRFRPPAGNEFNRVEMPGIWAAGTVFSRSPRPGTASAEALNEAPAEPAGGAAEPGAGTVDVVGPETEPVPVPTPTATLPAGPGWAGEPCEDVFEEEP